MGKFLQDEFLEFYFSGFWVWQGLDVLIDLIVFIMEKYFDLLSTHLEEVKNVISEEEKIDSQSRELLNVMKDEIEKIENERQEVIKKHSKILSALDSKKQYLLDYYDSQLKEKMEIRLKLHSDLSEPVQDAIHVSRQIEKKRDTAPRRGKVSKMNIVQLYKYYEICDPTKISYVSKSGIFGRFGVRKTIDLNTEVSDYLWSHRIAGSYEDFQYILFSLHDGSYGLINSEAKVPDHICLEIYVGSLWEIINFAMTDEIYQIYISSTIPI